MPDEVLAEEFEIPEEFVQRSRSWRHILNARRFCFDNETQPEVEHHLDPEEMEFKNILESSTNIDIDDELDERDLEVLGRIGIQSDDAHVRQPLSYLVYLH